MQFYEKDGSPRSPLALAEDFDKRLGVFGELACAGDNWGALNAEQIFLSLQMLVNDHHELVEASYEWFRQNKDRPVDAPKREEVPHVTRGTGGAQDAQGGRATTDTRETLVNELCFLHGVLHALDDDKLTSFPVPETPGPGQLPNEAEAYFHRICHVRALKAAQAARAVVAEGMGAEEHEWADSANAAVVAYVALVGAATGDLKGVTTTDAVHAVNCLVRRAYLVAYAALMGQKVVQHGSP